MIRGTRLFVVLSILLIFFAVQQSRVYATSYLTRVANLLSMSAPGALTNQTITFTLAQGVPANGAINISYAEGGFSIPSNLNFADVDVGFSAAPGGPYTQRPLSSIKTAGSDGVTVTSGTSGNVRINLNSSVGIPAGNQVQIRIGTNATFGAIGTRRFSLTSATGTYPITIRTLDAASNELDYGRTMIAVIEQVTAGPVDTTDTTPPVILSAEPTGILQVGTRAVQLFIQTDEPSTCRYATSSMSFAAMPYGLFGTSTGLVFWHFSIEGGLEDGTTYTYFIRCQDFRFNEIDPDYELEFTVGIPPGSATSTATTTGMGGDGSGTGTSTATTTSTCTGSECVGTGTGSGTGSSGGGSGSSSSGGDGSGSGTGGGGGNGATGTKLPQAAVLVEGWAYPGSVVSIMRDGTLVNGTNAGGGGEFSHRMEGLDRGSYSVAVYAVDVDGVRGATFATTLWIRSDTLSMLSNIMLPPTVTAPSSIELKSDLPVSGYTTPFAVVTASLRPKLAQVSSGDVVATTTALANGSWSLTLETAHLSQGTYELVAQAAMSDRSVESDRSVRKTVGVGVQVADETCLGRGDLNCDGVVNLVDFSILLFNWNSTSADADINGDGVVSLADFSIMLYHWTG